MKYTDEVNESLRKAREYVLAGGDQILNNRLDSMHGVSPSPGATALATLALSLLGNGFTRRSELGLNWLWQNRQENGWGKFPGDKPDKEISRLVRTVLTGCDGGIFGKLFLLSQVQGLSNLILALGKNVVHGLEGPKPNEIRLPEILNEHVMQKLPHYGRPVIIAASILAAEDKGQYGVSQAIEYLSKTQMSDGSWSEDIISTSLAILAKIRVNVFDESLIRAGRWLSERQYEDGAWPAFNQLQTWAMGWTLNIFMEFERSQKEDAWLFQAVKWLEKGQNSDGSYGGTPPFSHPDLDDTAIALLGLQQFPETKTNYIAEFLRKFQNDDGSWGTFPSFNGVPPSLECEFPVYISSTDVTLHILEALWGNDYNKYKKEIYRGLHWLIGQQHKSGEIPSVWFEGPMYSTAQTLELLAKYRIGWGQWRISREIFDSQNKACKYLLSNQNSDGGWGSSVIDTSLTLAALYYYKKDVPREVYEQGIKEILARQLSNGAFPSSYQGIYAKGWNYEEPITTALTAIRALERYKLLGKEYR